MPERLNSVGMKVSAQLCTPQQNAGVHEKWRLVTLFFIVSCVHYRHLYYDWALPFNYSLGIRLASVHPSYVNRGKKT